MGKEYKKNKVLFSGYAKLPENTCGAEVSRIVGVIVVVDMDADGRIIDAECTLPTSVARNLIAAILIGRPLAAGPERLVDEIAAVFQDTSLRALITAVRIVCSRYANHIQTQRPILVIKGQPEQQYDSQDATAS